MREKSLQVLMAAGLDALAGDPPDVLHPVYWTGKTIAGSGEAYLPHAARLWRWRTTVRVCTLGMPSRCLSASLLPGSGKGRGMAAMAWPAAATIDAAISFQAVGRAEAVRSATLLEAGDLEPGQGKRRGDGRPGHAVISRAGKWCAPRWRRWRRTPLTASSPPASTPCWEEREAAFLYRTVNTLDSMTGYRNQRYLKFGWASARLDDLANLLALPRHGGLSAGSRVPAAAVICYNL